MIIRPTPVDGVHEIALEPHEDERGSFARIFCRKEFAASGLDPDVAQCNLSANRKRGTLRGLHYQAAPSTESKVVRCVQGAIFDVALDLRPGSPSYLEHHAVELSAGNGRALYVPAGCAHGFQTLEDDTVVLYLMSDFYQPELSRGVRWNDPAFGIAWPMEDPIILDRDRDYPDYEGSAAGV